MKNKRRYRFRSTCKGIKEYNQIINYFLLKDKLTGKTYDQLAIEYKMDRSCIAKRVKSELKL